MTIDQRGRHSFGEKPGPRTVTALHGCQRKQLPFITTCTGQARRRRLLLVTLTYHAPRQIATRNWLPTTETSIPGLPDGAKYRPFGLVFKAVTGQQIGQDSKAGDYTKLLARKLW